MYKDSDKDKIVKHILCADTQLKMWTQHVYLR